MKLSDFSPTELMAKLRANSATVSAEKKHRIEIAALRKELREAVFHEGHDVGEPLQFFNSAIAAGAMKNRCAKDGEGFEAEKQYLRNVIATVRGKSAAETGSFPGPGAPVALPTVSAASLSPAGSPAITAAVATKPATASTTAASPSPAVPPVSSAAPAAAAPQLRGIDRVQAAIAKQIATASTSAAAGKPTAVQLAALGEVLGIERGESDDATLLSQCERAAFESHLRFPGMAADEALASKFSRISADRIKGMLRIERATRQQRIDAIFREKRRS